MSNFGQVLPVTGLLLGFPGHVTRSGIRVITAKRVLSTTANPIQFGQAVVINPATNTYQSVADFIAGGGTMTAALFAGIAVEEVTTTVGYPYSPDSGTVGSYVQGSIAEALSQGSIIVPINNGTPASQGVVYLRTAVNEAVPAGVVGGLEAANTTGTIPLTGVVFENGSPDSNDSAEITLLNRVAA